MLVAALLSPALLAHLRVVLRTGHDLAAVPNWGALDSLVRERPLDVVVVDPGFQGKPQTSEIGRFRERFPSLPLVVYTAFAPASMRTLVELTRIGVHQVVIQRFDDAPARFLAVLERQRHSALGDRLLVRLERSLARLPASLSHAIQQLFSLSLDYREVTDLALASSLPERTMYRQLNLAGIASPRLVLAASRLLRAYASMRDPGYSLAEVSKKLGFSSPWYFTRQMRALTGLTPRVVRRSLGPEEFLDRLALKLLEPGKLADDRAHAYRAGGPILRRGRSERDQR